MPRTVRQRLSQGGSIKSPVKLTQREFIRLPMHAFFLLDIFATTLNLQSIFM
jgi:hypothetical protein